MAIKELYVYNNGSWGNPYEIGAKASNISLSPSITIGGQSYSDVQTAIASLVSTIPVVPSTYSDTNITLSTERLGENSLSAFLNALVGTNNFTNNYLVVTDNNGKLSSSSIKVEGDASPVVSIGSNISSVSRLSLASAVSSISLNKGKIYNSGNDSISISPGEVTNDAGDITLTINGTGAIFAPNVNGAVSLGSTTNRWNSLSLGSTVTNQHTAGLFYNSNQNISLIGDTTTNNSNLHIGVQDNVWSVYPHTTAMNLGSTALPFQTIHAGAGGVKIKNALLTEGGGILTITPNNTTTAKAQLLFEQTNTEGNGDFYPNNTNKISLGTSGLRFSTAWFSNPITEGSDRNLKKNINQLSSKYLELFKELIPVSYQFRDNTSGRYHIGFISQDVEQALQKVGLTAFDFAGFCKDTLEDGTEIYSLRYSEFIALNTAVIQQQQKTIDDLSIRLAALEAKIN